MIGNLNAASTMAEKWTIHLHISRPSIEVKVQVLNFTKLRKLIHHVLLGCFFVHIANHDDPTFDGWSTEMRIKPPTKQRNIHRAARMSTSFVCAVSTLSYVASVLDGRSSPPAWSSWNGSQVNWATTYQYFENLFLFYGQLPLLRLNKVNTTSPKVEVQKPRRTVINIHLIVGHGGVLVRAWHCHDVVCRAQLLGTVVIHSSSISILIHLRKRWHLRKTFKKAWKNAVRYMRHDVVISLGDMLALGSLRRSEYVATDQYCG